MKLYIFLLARVHLQTFAEDLGRVLMIEGLRFVLVDERSQDCLDLIMDTISKSHVMLSQTGAETYW